MAQEPNECWHGIQALSEAGGWFYSDPAHPQNFPRDLKGAHVMILQSEGDYFASSPLVSLDAAASTVRVENAV